MSDTINAGVMQVVRAAISRRWDIGITTYTDDAVFLMLGISLGLNGLFNDCREAETDWLSEPRVIFGGKSAIQHIRGGGMPEIQDVADRVAMAAGLR